MQTTESSAHGIMEFHHPAVPKHCIRQASFPTASSHPHMVTYSTRQMSLPTEATSESNGFVPKPLTTSQHHPPKITLLNRSPAVNLSSPTPTDSSSQPSSAEDLRVTSVTSLSDESLGGTAPKPPSEEEEALATARPPLSTDSSFDYKDSSGIDLHEFIVKTLRENPRDRLMLLKLERDFTGFITDETIQVYKYPPMTSYHRMLVHRVAAYFGLEHNVDQTGKCVIVNKNAATRIPECSFQMYCSREYSDEEISQLPRAILKRANSSEEFATPPRPRSPAPSLKSLEDKKSRSIEEREHDYEKARARIFQDSVSSQSSIESSDVSATSSSTSQVSPATAAITENGTRQSTVAPRFQDWGEQKNAEREAAIAAAAAATGNEGGNVRYMAPRKRWPKYDQARYDVIPAADATGHVSMQPGPGSEMQYGSQQTVMGGQGSGVYINIGQEGVSPSPLWINPATGQPVSGHEASQIMYQQGFPIGRQMYQGQHQMHPQGSQQTAYPYVMPLQYSGGPQQHYYLVHSQGDRAGLHSGQDAAGNLHSLPTHQLSYHDVTGQMANMSLAHRHPDTGEDDTASTDSYPTTPTPPPGTPADMQQQLMMSGTPYVIVPQQRQMLSNQMYQNQMPVHYIPGQGYVTYSPYAQYVTVPESGLRYPQSHTPPVQQPRSPSPILLGSPYLANPSPVQSHVGRPGPLQTPPFTRTPPPSSSPYIRSALPNGAMIIPMGQSASAHSGSSMVGGNVTQPATSSAPTHWRGQQSRRGGKGANGWNHESMNYQALAQEGQRVQQNIASFSGQTRPPVVKMIQVPPHFPLMSGQRFHQNQSPFNQYPAYVQSSYKRGKPRIQGRTPKHISSSSDDETKTVNHILEVYDMPDGLSASESEALLKELETVGGRILRINNSSVGSAAQNATGPTVLAIFKSASDAQQALETVKNPKFKLRVSQKSPTHITTDNNVTTKSSTSST